MNPLASLRVDSIPRVREFKLHPPGTDVLLWWEVVEVEHRSSCMAHVFADQRAPEPRGCGACVVPCVVPVGA